jgi:hypothetical protein
MLTQQWNLFLWNGCDKNQFGCETARRGHVLAAVCHVMDNPLLRLARFFFCSVSCPFE